MTFMKTAAVLAALAAAVASAQAGPDPSPFAGTFAWNGGSSWAVTISDGGQIKGSLVSSYFYTKGSLGGKVDDNGNYSFTMSVTFPTMDNPERRTHGPQFRTVHYQFAGVMAPDANGNLVGTPSNSDSFTWLRQ